MNVFCAALLCLTLINSINLDAVSATANEVKTQCPPTISSILSSSLYAVCRQDVAAILEPKAIPSWIFTVDNTDYLHSSEACMTAIFSLQDIDFSACEETIAPFGTTSTDTRIVVEKSVVDKIAMPCRTRRLRPAEGQMSRSLSDRTTETFDWTYVYIGLAVSLAVSLFCCLFDVYVRWRHRVAREQSGGAADYIHVGEKSAHA